MNDLGLYAGKPVWVCISMSHTVNRELEHAEPACTDTSLWRHWESTWSAHGQRWWEHPAVEELAKSPACAQPCSCLPLAAHQLWAVGTAGGTCTLLTDPSRCSGFPWALLATQAAPQAHPRGMPCENHPLQFQH